MQFSIYSMISQQITILTLLYKLLRNGVFAEDEPS
jgi:hypothetical protein